MSKTIFLEVISFFWHMWLEVGVRWATCWRKSSFFLNYREVVDMQALGGRKLFKVREVGVMMSLGGRKCHFDIAFDNTSSPRELSICVVLQGVRGQARVQVHHNLISKYFVTWMYYKTVRINLIKGVWYVSMVHFFCGRTPCSIVAKVIRVVMVAGRK